MLKFSFGPHEPQLSKSRGRPFGFVVFTFPRPLRASKVTDTLPNAFPRIEKDGGYNLYAPYWIIADFLLLLLPLIFLALAALAWKLDGKKIYKYGLQIQEACLIGPTIFPLAFAAVCGRSLKKIALWRAERGTTLGFIEHIIGSQTIVSTIGHAITLHSLDFLTVGLLALWALSPLGGQSSLRMVRQTNSTITDTRPVFYADLNAPSEFAYESYNEDAFNRANAVVSTVLITADNLEWTPVDTWNHPKIPRLEELEQAEARNLSAQATNVPNGATQMKYLRDLDSTAKLESGGQFVRNATVSLAPKGSMTQSFFIYARGPAFKPDALVYGSRMIASAYFLFECSMKSVIVEANIVCKSDTCAIERLRRLNIPRNRRNSINLPYDVINSGTKTRYFIRYLAEIGGENSIFKTNPVDAYIYGVKPWAVGLSRTVSPVHNWTQYIKNSQKSIDMSHRFTRFLNTYWDASRWPEAMTRNDPFAKSSLDETNGEPTKSMTMNKTKAIITRQVPVF
ncbi:hypothetical protein GQ44DRAFT_771117 [Phaeosphaeriaceae sp. PMI808]|nr:hypothetical protein GQ44DRAFT_771117 [Phaeosphaeriaceae sp. PMI808]